MPRPHKYLRKYKKGNTWLYVYKKEETPKSIHKKMTKKYKQKVKDIADAFGKLAHKDKPEASKYELYTKLLDIHGYLERGRGPLEIGNLHQTTIDVFKQFLKNNKMKLNRKVVDDLKNINKIVGTDVMTKLVSDMDKEVPAKKEKPKPKTEIEVENSAKLSDMKTVLPKKEKIIDTYIRNFIVKMKDGKFYYKRNSRMGFNSKKEVEDILKKKYEMVKDYPNKFFLGYLDMRQEDFAKLPDKEKKKALEQYFIHQFDIDVNNTVDYKLQEKLEKEKSAKIYEKIRKDKEAGKFIDLGFINAYDVDKLPFKLENDEIRKKVGSHVYEVTSKKGNYRYLVDTSG